VGRNRSGILELAVLGELSKTPMHGYELRKRLSAVLGAFRALSYGSLYPCLHELLAAGLIAEEQDEAGPLTPAAGR
jgi:DNA-binding PadR family transcriptional regulator